MQTNRPQSGWTPETLLAHFTQRLEDLDKRHEQSLVALERATDLAKANLTAWQLHANEWREAMKDREAHFMQRQEALQMLKGMEEKIADLRESRDTTGGRSAGLNAGWSYVLGAAGLILSLVSLGLLILRTHQ